MDGKFPGVTVVVPTLNRGDYLVDTLQDLLAQTHRPLEILVVDQSRNPSAELQQLAAANPDVISHHSVAFQGLPNARNYGWRRARHELLVYVDDDIRCDPGLIEAHVASLTEPGVGVVGGGVEECGASTSAVEMPWYDRWKAFPQGGFSSWATGSVDHAKGCNFGACRAVLRNVGGFDERLSMGAALHEETDLCLRVLEAGYVVRFNGTARLSHLAAGGGGTRQLNWRRYVHALAHNRSIMIRRHSRWYQWPVGFAWSSKLILAYTLYHREPRILLAGIRGVAQGWRAGGRAPMCTCFAVDEP